MVYELPYFKRLQGAVFWLMLFAVGIHLLWYHGSKPLMDLAGILAIVVAVRNYKVVFSGVSPYLWGWCLILLMVPVSYYIAFQLHGSALDEQLLKRAIRMFALMFSVMLVCRCYQRNINQPIVWAMVACAFLGGGLGFLDWAMKGFEGRTAAGAEIINLYAAALTAVTAVTFLLIGKVNRMSLQLLIVVTIFLGFLGVIASGSRAALAALILIVFSIALFQFRGNARKYLLLILSVATVSLLMLEPVQQRIDAARSQIVDYYQPDVTEAAQSTSVGIRLEMWYLSTKYIAEKPIEGYGNKPLSEIFSEQIIDESSPRYLSEFHHVHSDALQAFLSRGVFGFLIYALLLIYPVLVAFANKFEHRKVVLVIAASFFLTGLTDVVLIKTVSQILYLAMMTLLLCAGWKDNNDKALQTA